MAQHTETSEQETAALEVGLDTLEDIAAAQREILALISDQVALPSECMPTKGFTYRTTMYTRNASAGGYVQLDWFEAPHRLRVSLWAGGCMWYAREIGITEIDTSDG